MIFFETARQSRAFLLLLYAGAAAGLLYDLCALLRRRLPRPLAAICDGLWCLLAAGLCVLALAMSGEDSLRAYALLGMVCGGGIYSLGARRTIAALIGLLRRLKPGNRHDPPGSRKDTHDTL